MKTMFGAKPWFKATRLKRTALFLLFDLVAVCASLWGAFWLRFDGNVPAFYLAKAPPYAGLWLGVRLVTFYAVRLYRMSWSYVGLGEIIEVLKGVTFSSLVLVVVSSLLRSTHLFVEFPRSIFVIDTLLVSALISASRLAKRAYGLLQPPPDGVPTLVVGAGDAGEQLVRSMLREKTGLYRPVGFVDDDPGKVGLTIHGLRVLGGLDALDTWAARLKVQAVFIAMPSATSKVIRHAVERSRLAGVQKLKVLPPLSEIFFGEVDATKLREVNLEDLLGRLPITIDTHAVQRYLQGKTVLITGAAGSIGSELCRQVARFSPQKLLALDHNETGLFELETLLGEQFVSLDCETVIADIRDRPKMNAVFARYRPQIVFHAAAYKHVHLMERFPEESAKTNVIGSYIVGQAALAHGAENVVLISTDKAVNPPNVYGATKRLAETLTVALNRRGTTRFTVVRFGNVLGSRGSVVPTFERQIKRRGPVTVTDPKMERYFMITSEAVLLVLQASAMGRGGEVLVLDMGKPVKIVELARELIRLHGFEPDKDIPIVFSGSRPGERLFEDLLTAEEGTQATRHERVFQARLSSAIPEEQLWQAIEAFEQGGLKSKADIVRWLQALVPEFVPAETKQRS